MPLGQESDNDDVFLKGGTTDQKIGNVADALKVVQQGTLVTSPSEPATFVAVAQDVAIGNNKSMISIVNTTGSTVTIKILEMSVVNVQITPVTGVIASFSLFRITAHSAGTLVSTASMLTSDTVSASVSVRTGSTVSGEVTIPLMKRIRWSTDEWGVGSVDVESSQNIAQHTTPFWASPLQGKKLTLLPDEGITIKQTVNSTVGTFDVSLTFSQE